MVQHPTPFLAASRLLIAGSHGQRLPGDRLRLVPWWRRHGTPLLFLALTAATATVCAGCSHDELHVRLQFFFLIHRSHFIGFTRAQGIPEYKIRFGRVCHGAVDEQLGSSASFCAQRLSIALQTWLVATTVALAAILCLFQPARGLMFWRLGSHRYSWTSYYADPHLEHLEHQALLWDAVVADPMLVSSSMLRALSLWET
jgi:hypothetical protein